MIAATELRLGSFVFVENEKYHAKLKNIPLQVTGMSLTTGLDDETTYSITLNHPKEEPNSYNETYSQFIKFIEPIPLTPEILEKVGFITDGDEYIGGVVWYKENSGIGVVVLPGKKFMPMYAGYLMSQNACIYVHRLQNLYHSITNTDLILSL